MGALATFDVLGIGTSIELTSQRGERVIATGIALPTPQQGEIVAAFFFTFATASPVNLGSIVAGSLFNRSLVLVTTAFDDPSAMLTLGPSLAPTALLAATDSQLDKAAQYETDLVVSSGSDFLQLTINPGASTQGAGVILWKVLPP